MTLKSHQLFVSYKREDLEEVKEIERLLRANGITVWRDLEYLPVGIDTEQEIRRAIMEECSGFLFYVTPNSLGSDFIWRIELPAAIERSQRENGLFPIIPVFRSADLVSPFKERCFAHLGGVDLANRNGFVLPSGNLDRNTILDIASRLLAQLISRSDYTPVEVFTKAPIPRSIADHLVLDWSPFFRESSPPNDVWTSILIPCLHNVRKALSEKEVPQFDVWLPSRIHLTAAVAFGWVFRRTTGFRLVASDVLRAENPEDDINTDAMERLSFDVRDGKEGRRNLCLSISIAKNVRPTLTRMVNQGFGYRVNVSARMGNIGSAAIVNTTHAFLLAEQAVAELIRVRDQYLTDTTDLIIASSVQFAAYIGWWLNACGDFTVWEFRNKSQTCVQSLNLDCLFDTDT